MPIIDVNSLKVADLKRELKERGLSLTGNKTELQERLQSALSGEPLLDDSSIAGEDILDEEGVLSDEEKILGADENELLKSPSSTSVSVLSKATNDNVLNEDDILESPTSATKKIVLKRKISIGLPADSSSVTTKENTEPTGEKLAKTNERKPITMDGGPSAATKKLSQLSMQERLELRAKKFGITASSVSSTTNTTTATNSTAISQAPTVSSEKQVELLKKRAERFGCVTSTNLVKLDTEEKLLKRKQRFGIEANSAPAGGNSDEWAEKARKRLERFGGGGTATTANSAVTSNTPAPATAAATN